MRSTPTASPVAVAASSEARLNRFKRSETCVGCSDGQAPIEGFFGLLNVAEYDLAPRAAPPGPFGTGEGRFGGWEKWQSASETEGRKKRKGLAQ